MLTPQRESPKTESGAASSASAGSLSLCFVFLLLLVLIPRFVPVRPLRLQPPSASPGTSGLCELPYGARSTLPCANALSQGRNFRAQPPERESQSEEQK